MRRAVLLVVLALAATGCGSAKPVTKKITVRRISSGRFLATRIQDTYGSGQELFEPPSLDFAVDGDLSAENLTWAAWGASTTYGQGTLLFQVQDRPTPPETMQGTVILSGLTVCDAQIWYTRAKVEAPDDPWPKISPTIFDTPCST